MQYQDGNITLTAAVNIPAFARVSINASGQATLAGAGNNWIGTAQAVASAGELVAVQVRGAAGTTPMIASGAISLGAPVYPTASGKVGGSPINGVGTPVGIAREAATADNQEFEVIQVDSNGPGVVFMGHTSTGASPQDVDTGLGVNPTFAFALIRSTAGAIRLPATGLTFPGSAGIVRITDAGLATNEQILVIAIR